MLPAQPHVIAAAVAALTDGQLVCGHVYPPLSATHHTTETENSQGHGVLLSNCYHWGGSSQLSAPTGYQILRPFCCLQCCNF